MPAQSIYIHLLNLPAQTFARKWYIYNTLSFLLFCLFLTISFSATHSFAQYTYELDKSTRFEKMGAEDGLTSEYMLCLHQDMYGFIWIGTVIGLNLYDGYEVKIFTANPMDTLSIFSNWINSIYEESDGTMWFCTDIGISKFDRANQTFNNYIPDTIDLYNNHNNTRKIVQDGDYLWVDAENDLFRFDKRTSTFKSFKNNLLIPEKGINGATTDYIFMDVSGVLWVGSSESGGEMVLNRFNKETGRFVNFRNDPSDPWSFAGKKVMWMMQDPQGTIWIATSGGGLLEMIDQENGKFRQFVHDENDTYSIIHNHLRSVFEDSKGNIWTGGFSGFSQLNKKTGRFTNYQVPYISESAKWLNIITSIYEDKDGELWLNANEGFFRFNPSANELFHYLYDPENLSGISDNNIQQILLDRTGQTWLALRDKGINKINPFSKNFRKIQKKANVDNSLSSNHISRFYTDSWGNFWIGGFRGGLNRTKMNNKKVFEDFEHFILDPGGPNRLYANCITAIYEDQYRIMWFGTLYGLNSYDYSTNKFVHYKHDPDDNSTVSSNDIESIFEDSQGTLWIGTRNGLNIMNRKTEEFIHFSPDTKDSNSISSLDISVIFEDSRHDLWFGGTFLDKLIRKDTSFIHYLPDTRSSSDLYRNYIWEIEEDDSSNLWITSDRGGLYKMDRNKSTFTAFTTNNGLPSNAVESLEIDDNGDIWIATNKGLSRITCDNYEIKNFDVADGLVNLELTDRSLYKDADGWLYVGGRDGFNIFHPDSIKENKFIPPVYITSLHVAGNPKYFDKPLYEMSTIELRHNENDFSFDFVALNYVNSQKNQYAYMLEGYDEEWIVAGNRRTAYYTNLNPGKYTFRVKGSNNDGYWNADGASLAMLILPPFWKTWWAYLVYALTFFVLVYVLRRNELNKIKLRQELKLKEVQAEQQAELDLEKNKFFSNISHEFRTPLTLILGPLDRFIGKLESEDQKQELNLIRRNARRLQTLINQLLSLSKLESGKMKLKARPENIIKLTGLFLQSFHSMAVDRGIKLEFESDAEECMVYLDPLKFEKIVNNLLSNAFKFTERGGRIAVTVTANKSSVVSRQSLVDRQNTEDWGLKTEDFRGRGVLIKISDTGSGIKLEDLPHVFDRFYQVDEQQMKTNLGTGIGLALTNELVELHHGTITAESDFGMGTTFTIFLPMGKDHLAEDEIIESDISIAQTEDDLLYDEFLYAGDAAVKSDIQTAETANQNLPLILIVEDNEDMRSYIKSYLVDSYNIIEASDGQEGADLAIEHIPDLIVSDLMMPKLDGNQMTIQLKTDERTSHIPVILLTAKASKESKLEGLETGADDFLTKPFDADELLVRIKNLIEQRKRLSILLSKHIGDVSQTRIIKESAGRAMGKMDEQFLERAKEIIDEHMSDPDFSIELFAEKMAMSRMQIHRKLKNLTDNSASDFIRNIRLVKAAELLREGELNVTQISYEIGMSSLSNFAKIFKEKYGVNPSEYS